MTTILLNAVFNPPLEIAHRSGQQLLIDREHFLPDGILQLVQITGVRECTHGPSGTPRGRNHMKTSQETLGALGYEEGSGHIAVSCRTSTSVREVPGSNLCSDTFSEDWGFSVSLSFLSGTYEDNGLGSSVGIVTAYRLDGSGIESIFRTCPDRPWGPPSLL